MRIRIYYEDTDAGGVVYHSRYLNFCERARSELFFGRGVDFSPAGGQFVVSGLKCSFLKPAHLGELILVRSRLLQLKNASAVLGQEIFLLPDDPTGSEATEPAEPAALGPQLFAAKLILAFVKDGRPARMSEELKHILQGLA